MGATVLSLRQLYAKKYKFLDSLPPAVLKSFGTLTNNFIMIIWGPSGNGKTNLIMQLLKAMMPHGRVLYVALEEGHEASMQVTALRQLDEEIHTGKIMFADHTMRFENLKKRLGKRRSEQFIVIDSIQYSDINYEMYKELKEKFSNKTFIYISHCKGKIPDGKVADRIRYDATIKVRVEGFVAFCTSRLGGNLPYVIYEDGARKYWGDKYKNIVKGKLK